MFESFSRTATPLERIALGRLTASEVYPGLPALPPEQCAVRVFRFEGLGRYFVWLVWFEGESYSVRRVVWDRPGDLARNASEPKTFGSDGPLPQADVARMLQELKAITIRPFGSEPAMGLDGTTFGIQWGNFWRGATLHWWNEPPPDWRALGEWVDGAIRLFESQLPKEWSK